MNALHVMPDVQPDALPSSSATEIALIDLSSLAHPIWHMSQSEPDPDFTSRQVVTRVRALTSQYPRAAICCDSGRSFRADICATYKANRPQLDAPLHHQIRLAREQLQADGYPVWAIKGLEADDLIATAVLQALRMPDVSVLVVSSDKDLLQLVGPRVRVMSATTRTVYDIEAVQAKFCVRPDQIRDFLTLVGDASDNIKGAVGIGPKKAADLLVRYGTLEGIYHALDKRPTEFKPAMATALREFQPRMAETRALVTLRTDAEIPFHEIDNDRSPSAEPMGEEEPMAEQLLEWAEKPAEPEKPAQQATTPSPPQEPVVLPAEQHRAEQEKPRPAPQPLQAMVEQRQASAPDALAPAPVEFERQLEPRSLPQAMSLANHMHAARMFNGYGSPQAVLSTVLAGRELGLQAIASLRAFHVIEGKHALAADAMRGLVLRSGQAKYFRVIERTAEVATFETWRHGEPEPVRLSYTLGEGWAAFKPELPEPERRKKWDASAWGKHTADMLSARASSKLARLVYSDILFGLYSPEEISDGN